MTSEGLPRSWRISRAADLEAVLDHGRRRRTPRLDIVCCPNDTGHPRLAVIVPRHGRTIVRRNRLRRRLREVTRRRILPELAALDVVLRARGLAYDARVADLTADLEQWQRSLSA